MAWLELKIILLVAFCSLTIEASVQEFNLKHKSSDDRPFFTTRANVFEDGRFIYFTRRQSTPTEKNVTVHLLKSPITKETISCNVTLKVQQNDTEIYDDFDISHLGQDRGLLSWLEIISKCENKSEECHHPSSSKSYLHFLIIHFPTCKVTEAKLENDGQRVIYASGEMAVPFDNYFDLFFGHEKYCQNWICRMSIDYDGKVIREPAPYINFADGNYLYTVKPRDEYNSKEGHVYWRLHDGNSIVNWIKPDGTEKLLASKDDNAEIMISILNETIGICNYPSDLRYFFTLQCAMYNSDGNLKWESNFNFKALSPYSLFNLGDDGLLILFEIIEKECERCKHDIVGYSVRKIDSTGKYVGEFRLQGEIDTHDTVKQPSIWKNRDGEGYCAAFGMLIYKDSPIIFGNCFTDADFS